MTVSLKWQFFCHNKTKCSNTNSYTSSISLLFFYTGERGHRGKWDTFMKTLHYQNCILHMHTFFSSIEPVLSRGAISLPLLMISLLPVIPQYIFKAIHLHFLLLNTTPVFSIVSAEGQLIVPVVELPAAFITHFQ